MKTKTDKFYKTVIGLIVFLLLLLFGVVIAVFLRKPEKGKSAYEVAVENGFQGTQSEWI